MKVLFVFLFFVICVYGLTCDGGNEHYCGTSEYCSDHCKMNGKRDSQCELHSRDQYCICYCDNDNKSFLNTETNDIVPFWKLPSFNSEDNVVLNSTKLSTTDKIIVETDDSLVKKYYDIGHKITPDGAKCEIASSKYCMNWQQCLSGCHEYFPGSTVCLLGHRGATTECCVCNYCGGCEFGYCPCSMGCGCR